MSDRFVAPRRLGIAGLIAFVVASFLALLAFAAGASAGGISSSGPIDQISVNSQLGCNIDNNEHQQFDTGEVVENYCGTFVGLGGTVYGDLNAGDAADSSYTIENPNQTTSGTGTSADPFKLTTVVHVVAPEVPTSSRETAAQPALVAGSLLTVTETETYVNGDDFYRTDVTVHNDQSFQQDPVLYHAGDCSINSDVGFAVNDTANSGAVFCTPQQLREINLQSTVPPQGNTQGILGFVPISSGSQYREALAGEGDGPLFDAINGNPFTNQCDDCNLNPSDPEEPDQPVDNGTGISWALSLAGGAEQKRCFLTVDSFTNHVPNVPSGCTPASNPPTIAQNPPPVCKLRISRARVFLFSRHPRLRLVARYRTAAPADVQINFKAIENGNKVDLGEITRHFNDHGLFRLRHELSQDESDSLWQTHMFVVHFKIPGEPGFCQRKYRKELTIPRIVDGQRVVFQSDSKFGPGSPGHPEHG